MKTIYIKGPKPRSMAALIKKFLGGDTMDANIGVVLGVESYANKECTNWQCNAQKMRSFEDIFDCVKTYFKTATRKRVLEEILRLNMSYGAFKFYPQFGYCGGMRKIKIYYARGASRFTNLDLTGKSLQSWNNLFLTLGLKGESQVREYIIANKKTS